MNYDTLGDRMKKGYENVYRSYFPDRLPVIIRLDGKAFHGFTRGLKKPYDSLFIKTMQDTMEYLCSNIQDCRFGYVESDEISLCLWSWDNNDSMAWFGNNLQKMVSVSASMAGVAFNKFWAKNVDEYLALDGSDTTEEEEKYRTAIKNKRDNLMPVFDARAFVVPNRGEVHNYFVWRQNDCVRNSIQGLAQSLYSQREIHGIDTTKLQNKMFTEKGVSWNDFTIVERRGTCIYKVPTKVIGLNGEVVIRNKWTMDKYMPILSKPESKDFVVSKVFRNESLYEPKEG